MESKRTRIIPVGAIENAFSNVPLTTRPIEDGEHIGKLVYISLTDSEKSPVVFVVAELETNIHEEVKARWQIIKKTGEPNEVGISIFRKCMRVLGYEESKEVRFNERNLEKIFHDLNTEQPRIKFWVSTYFEYVNIHFTEML